MSIKIETTNPLSHSVKDVYMNNFEIHEQAQVLSDTKSSYALARNVVMLTEELNTLRQELEGVDKLKSQYRNLSARAINHYHELISRVGDTTVSNIDYEQLKSTLNNLDFRLDKLDGLE